jgi:hypothetical protein
LKTPVFYSHIRPAYGQTLVEIIRRAHALGYELMPFNGWDDADIGYPGNRGPHYVASRENLKCCIEIQDASMVHTPEGADWPHITHGIRR